MRRKLRTVSLPHGFTVSERVKTWAAERGFGQLEAHLEHFVGYARATGRRYVDWDEALMNAIRADWAKLRVPSEARRLTVGEIGARRLAAETFRERDARLNRERVAQFAPQVAAKDPRAQEVIDVIALESH